MIFWRGFYLKTSLVFMILIAFLAIMQARISSDVFDNRRDEIDQRANVMLAADMALEISPYPDVEQYGDEIGSAIHYMMVLNPTIEIYLLDSEGAIEAYFADTDMPLSEDRVDIRPIQEFFAANRVLPIYGVDPRRPGSPSTFSAAQLNPQSPDNGYLYIILRSSRYDLARSQITDSYYNTALRRGLLLSLPVVAVIGFMMFFLLTRRLRSLTGIVREFGEGNHGVRARISSSDEIGELAGSFNSMATTIEDNLEALQRAESERRELVANISHDLKTPLAAISGYTETLLEKGENLSEEERRLYLEISQGSVETMRKRVDDLFRLSELENSGLTLKIEPFSLSELCQDVVLQLKPMGARRQVDLRMDRPADLCQVQGDIYQFERVLTNLIDNALRFAPAESEVTVSLIKENDVIRVNITDAGPGLSEEESSRVFDRFYTGDPSRSSGHSGLGLAIAKRIIDLHSGQIGVESEEGKGAIFFFTMPSLGR